MADDLLLVQVEFINQKSNVSYNWKCLESGIIAHRPLTLWIIGVIPSLYFPLAPAHKNHILIVQY